MKWKVNANPTRTRPNFSYPHPAHDLLFSDTRTRPMLGVSYPHPGPKQAIRGVRTYTLTHNHTTITHPILRRLAKVPYGDGIAQAHRIMNFTSFVRRLTHLLRVDPSLNLEHNAYDRKNKIMPGEVQAKYPRASNVTHVQVHRCSKKGGAR